ncbi:junctional adhesion molecule B-like [Macrobrachium rosenbergii]|uniref:junctional adhesion molecule B-like n=1 Tax=Macrobrachium rosenbergii TaxID=79674 RepID=UPI0034D3DCDC
MGSAPLPFVLLVLTSLVYSIKADLGSRDAGQVPGWETSSQGEPDFSEVVALPVAGSAAQAGPGYGNNTANSAGVNIEPSIANVGSNTTDNNVTTITAQLGSSVFLPCKTHHSMERQYLPQVSWVRRRDWHILTSGSLTYTQEERFSVHHPEGSTEWTLAIKYVALEDAGTYECQISTGGGLLSRLVYLDVIVPRAVIPGHGEYHVDTGSTISLDCYIQQSSEAPQYIFWYHNTRMINYDRERGGVNVHIDTGPRVRSRLTLTHATPADSGNYTCAAANTEPASITVYITEGNKIAAIQPRAVDGALSHRASVGLLTTGLLLAWCLVSIH